MDWLFLGELAINGALTGLMYALCALGLVLIYKTSGVANLSQGALIMTGGYLAAWLTTGLGLSLPFAIPIGPGPCATGAPGLARSPVPWRSGWRIAR